MVTTLNTKKKGKERVIVIPFLNEALPITYTRNLKSFKDILYKECEPNTGASMRPSDYSKLMLRLSTILGVKE